MTRESRRRLEIAGGSVAIGFVIILAIARGKSIEGIVLILLFGALILIAYMWVTDHILKPPGA